MSFFFVQFFEGGIHVAVGNQARTIDLFSSHRKVYRIGLENTEMLAIKILNCAV